MLCKSVRGQCGGKGRVETQAKASFLGEPVERFSGVWRGDVELAVVTVVVPDARHFWCRLGRTPIAEADVNPDSVLF